MSDKTPFEYGWCETDLKKGKGINPYYRKVDYINDAPYAARLKVMLEQLGLPFPKPDEVYRGSHHDLLFLNSHGVVLRIGPTDVQDLINPAILQPLGWLEDRSLPAKLEGVKDPVEAPFTVAIYPGVELYKNWRREIPGEMTSGAAIDRLATDLYRTEQGCVDVREDNIGIVRVIDTDGNETAISLLMDSDNSFNGSSSYIAETRARRMTTAGKLIENQGDIMSDVLQSDVFTPTDRQPLYQRAFEVHQPLRRLFWEAFGNVMKNEDRPPIMARDLFWQGCATVTNNPKSTIVPVWHAETAEDGTKQFTREEVCVPAVVLRRPWTGEAADAAIQPINITPEVRRALAERPGQKAAPSLDGTRNKIHVSL